MKTKRAPARAKARPKKAEAPTGAGFSGWPKSGLQFFVGLERDNSKAFYEANRQVYESDVRRPMENLLEELRRDVGGGWETKIFRINRDLRFTKDKRPYQEHIGAVFTSDQRAAGFYIQLSTGGLYTAIGGHELAPDQVARFRDSVAGSKGEQLARIVGKLIAQGYDLSDPSLKRVPPGYDAGHPRADLLRRTSMMASRNLAPGPWLHSSEALTRVREAWKDARPLCEWLDTHVGPSRAPRSR
jgi:uncharacterized protein (TIGR02453 family)